MDGPMPRAIGRNCSRGASSAAVTRLRRASVVGTISLIAMFGGAIVGTGCSPVNVDPSRATRHYPRELVQGEVVQVQVIPGPTWVEVVNATARSYRDFDLWLNQRYMVHIDALESGQTLKIPLSDFWDWRGEGPFEGGIFRYYAPTPIALMQAQLSPTDPLIGFVCVLPEGARDFYENPPALPVQPRR